jgi:pimeloyl-ACP methyl ester carboxylesterase
VLARSHRVIAVDQLGHGRSDRSHDAAAYTPALAAAHVLSVMDAEEVDRAGVWGYSLGALIAAEVAVAHPERAAWVVCAAQGPARDEASSQAGQRGAAAMVISSEALAQVLGVLGADAAFIADAVATNDPVALSAAMTGLVADFPAVAGCGVPSLFYLGDAERPYRAEELALAADGKTTLAVMPGADHVATFNRSDDALGIVLPFIAAQETGARG